jgi:hypothetical protein
MDEGRRGRLSKHDSGSSLMRVRIADFARVWTIGEAVELTSM